MPNKLLIIFLAFAICLGIYPNVLVGIFKLYLLDAAVLAIFIKSIFLIKYRIKAFDLFFILFFGASFIFLLLNTKNLFSFSAVFYLLRYSLYFLTYPFFIFISKKYSFFALRTYFLLVFCSLILNLIIFLVYPNLNVIGFDPHKFRLYGQFLDPNYYSIFLVLNFLVILNFVKKSNINPVIAFLSLVSIFLTFSRIGFIALLILFIFKFSKSKKVELIAIFIGILGLIFSNSAYLSRFLFVEGNFDSFFYRILDFLDGVVIYYTNLIPQGFNNMAVYNSFYTSGVNNSSSFYDFIILNFLLTGGIYFIFLFSVFFVYLAKNIKSLLIRECLFLIILSSFGMNIFFFPIFTLYFTILSSVGIVKDT